MDCLGDPLPPGAVARLGTLRLRHGGAVSSVAFSRDGKTLVSAGEDPVLRLWEVATGKEVRQFRGHQKAVLTVAFSPDNKTLVSGSEDHTIRIWDVATGRQLQEWTGPENAPLRLAMSPTGRLLATGGPENTVLLWDVLAGREVRRLKGHQKAVLALAFSPDGSAACQGPRTGASSCGTQSPARGCANTSPKEMPWGPWPSPRTACWSWPRAAEARLFFGKWLPLKNAAGWRGRDACRLLPDGKTLASADSEGTLHIWDVVTGQELHKVQGDKNGINTLAFSPDGKTLAGGDARGRVRIWDPATAKERAFGGLRDVLSAIRFGPGANNLISVDARAVRSWEARTGIEAHHMDLPQGDLDTLALADDGRTLAQTYGDRRIRLWDTVTGKELKGLTADAGHIMLLGFSPDGKVLACFGEDSLNVVQLWDLAAGKQTRQFRDPQGMVVDLDFAADGRTLSTLTVETTGDATIHVWEIASGKQRRHFRTLRIDNLDRSSCRPLRRRTVEWPP